MSIRYMPVWINAVWVAESAVSVSKEFWPTRGAYVPCEHLLGRRFDILGEHWRKFEPPQTVLGAGSSLNFTSAFAIKFDNVLGQMVSKRGVEVADVLSEVEITQNASVPKNRTDFRSFVESRGYYRRFMMSFSILSALLHALTSPENSFVWAE